MECARTGGRGVVVPRDEAGIAEAIVTRLAASGLSSRVIDDVSAVDEADGVIFIGGLADDDDPDTALASARCAFAYAQRFARRRAAGAGAPVAPGIFVTVQDTGGDFGIRGSARAYHGALAALAKTAALEWPDVGVKAIDCERGARAPSALADAIVEELLAGGPEVEVGLRGDGRRTTVVSIAETLPSGPPTPPALGPAPVLVCSGGGRGVTAATLVALAEATPPSKSLAIAVMGRTPLVAEPEACRGVLDDRGLKRHLLDAARAAGRQLTPAELGRQVGNILAGREVRATLAALANAGAEASYHAVDVSDRAAVAQTLDEIRTRYGPITGVIHGAGVLADKLIAEKTEAQFERVVRTKVEGLRALMDATAEDPLRTLVVFSSVAARTGNVGQCDYAMANEVLNKVAAHEARRRPDCRVAALGWGPWQGGMVTPALRAYFEAHGVPLIPLARGAQMLVEELSAPAPTSVEVVLGGAPRRASIAAAGATAEDLDGPTRFSLLLRRERQPYLRDHTIDEHPVVPVVLGVEWMVRAALATAPPHVEVASVDQIRIYRGLVLDAFQDGQWIRLDVSRGAREHTRDVTIVDPDSGRSRYAATVHLTPTSERAPAPGSDGLPAASPPPVLRGPMYGNSLFHGPAFQVVTDVHRLDETGLVATLVGVSQKDWGREPWVTDPAGLDGAVQLAVRWVEERLGGRSLPTSIDAVRLHTGALAETGPWRATCRPHVEGPGHVRSRITLETITSSGPRVVAILEGVETHRRP
ncbi:MAG: SDR family NAD(P)-dependent oxidoreductase [Myxococcota bacterium]